MRIAIVGAGISGNVCAWLLHRDHEIVLFEAESYAGGHTRTVDITLDGRNYSVDTGFMVFNDRTYPNFTRLLQQLDVPSQPSDMSFGVRCQRTGLEYQGSSLNGLFAQRRNLANPRFYGMLRDILRFNRSSTSFLREQNDRLTLGEYLARERYGEEFVQHYLIPMTAAIWSAPPRRVLEMPARFLITFCDNHGLLQLRGRPQWRTIPGGARRYVQAMASAWNVQLRLQSPVRSVRRYEDRVELTSAAGDEIAVDCVILACHADQALQILHDARDVERELLGHFPYQANRTILHVDTSFLPRSRRAWASWNYHIPAEANEPVAVTYDVNRLQSLGAPQPICVTLNYQDRIDASCILQTIDFEHPVFGPGTIDAQQALERINGVSRTYYCGAYLGYGFHEDGVRSALTVCRHFGKTMNS